MNLFDQKIARCLLGKNWSRQPESARAQWIAVPEMATYLHYNIIWNVPIYQQEKFFLEAPEIWRDVVPSGQLHLQVIGEEAGEAVAARTYSGKTFHPRWTIAGMYDTHQFWEPSSLRLYMPARAACHSLRHRDNRTGCNLLILR